MQIPLESSISFQLNANKNVLQVQLMHLIYDFPSPDVILFNLVARERKNHAAIAFSNSKIEGHGEHSGPSSLCGVDVVLVFFYMIELVNHYII